MSAYFCSERDCPRQWKNQRRKKCAACGKPTTRLKSLPEGARSYVLPDFPEHFNHSMGCVVKNRKHHERIQRERNLQDWQPVKESRMIEKLRREGHRI